MRSSGAPLYSKRFSSGVNLARLSWAVLWLQSHFPLLASLQSPFEAASDSKSKTALSLLSLSKTALSLSLSSLMLLLLTKKSHFMAEFQDRNCGR